MHPRSYLSKNFTLYDDAVSKGSEIHPLTDVTATVDKTGVLAKFLTVRGPGFVWTQRIDGSRVSATVKWANLVNMQATKFMAS